MAVQSAPMQVVRMHLGYLRAKRILDILFVLLISPLIFLVGAFVAALILLDSNGSVFYRQKRIGQNGVEFEMLKFRFLLLLSAI